MPGFIDVVATTSEKRFGSEKLADRNRPDALRVIGGKFAIDFLVVLAIIANQNPAYSWKLCCQPLKVCCFVLPTASKPAVGCGPPIGEQQWTDRE